MYSNSIYRKLQTVGQRIAGKGVKWLFALLLFSFILNLWGIHWGLPDYRGWAADEMTPSHLLNGIQHHFSHGWSEFYPPLHYYILAIAGIPVYILDLLNLLDFHGYLSYTLLFFIGRFISVLMGTGIIFIVYLCGIELISRKSALITALFMALNPSFVYYSKTINMDVPYLFWFSLSLLFYIRILKYHHQLRDYLLFAVMAAFAVCTKDQAYALYVLSPIPVLIALRRETGPSLPAYKIFIDKRILLTLLTGAFIFLFIYNVLFNFAGFINHLRTITGSHLELFREYPNSVQGHLNMFLKAIRHLRFAMGWPFFLVSCGGFLGTLIQKKKHPILPVLFVFIISYYLFMFVPIRYHYVRFFLPICLIFGYYGGYALDFLLTRIGHLKVVYPVIIAAGLYSFLMAASVNIAMTIDSRVSVEKWLEEHVRVNEQVAFVGWREYLPRKKDISGHYVPNATLEKLREISADYIVINDRICKCEGIYASLFDGSLGYQLIYEYQKTPWPTPWLYDQIYQGGQKRISTNLYKINPPIKIFQRIGDGTETLEQNRTP